MNRKSLRIAFATVLCLGTLASPALAQINISLDLGMAPPPPRAERIREGRPGYIWVQGFWFWDGRHHRWAKGHWEQERPGHRWVGARWDNRGGRHHYEPGRWEPIHDDRFERGHDEGRGHAYGRERNDDHRDDSRGRDDDHREGHGHR